MHRLIVPDIFPRHVTVFFTGKDPGSDPAAVSRIIGGREKDIYMPMQKHTDMVQVLDAVSEPRIADAVMTDRSGVILGVQVADCTPVLIYEQKRGIVAAVHAGWKGTAAGILKKTLLTMFERFAVGPDTCLVAIGPAIRRCCYGVGHDVYNEVRRQTGAGEYFIQKGDKHFLDLPAANRCQALSLGVRESDIWMSEECTYCSPDRFYSYRFSKGTTGRQGGYIGRL